MSRIEELAERYSRHISTPWQRTVSGAQRVIMVVYPLEKFPIILGNFKKRRDRFAKKFNLTHDVLRHTFISMFVAKFRSIGEAAIQAGNSESIIRKHYLDLKTTKEAEAFYGIVPKHAKVPIAPAVPLSNAA